MYPCSKVSVTALFHEFLNASPNKPNNPPNNVIKHQSNNPFNNGNKFVNDNCTCDLCSLGCNRNYRLLQNLFNIFFTSMPSVDNKVRKYRNVSVAHRDVGKFNPRTEVTSTMFPVRFDDVIGGVFTSTLNRKSSGNVNGVLFCRTLMLDIDGF